MIYIAWNSEFTIFMNKCFPIKEMVILNSIFIIRFYNFSTC